MLRHERSSSLGSSGWCNVLTMLPAIVVALLPKCPACLPAYAVVASSLGLGFLVDTVYLLPLAIVFLILAVAGLALRRNGRRLGPLALGAFGASTVLVGKFILDSSLMTFVGLAFLVAGSVWSIWPLKVIHDGACLGCFAQGSAPGTRNHEERA